MARGVQNSIPTQVAIMMSNAGGAWDNAKKYCEKDGTKGLSKEKNDDGSLK